MRVFYLFLFLLFCAACSKNSSSADNLPATGTWVETTLRLDTIDFTLSMNNPPATSKYLGLRAKPFTDQTGIVYLANIYAYEIEKNALSMRSMFSSSMAYNRYTLQVADENHFTIQRFYRRETLPQTIEFVRLP